MFIPLVTLRTIDTFLLIVHNLASPQYSFTSDRWIPTGTGKEKWRSHTLLFQLIRQALEPSAEAPEGRPLPSAKPSLCNQHTGSQLPVTRVLHSRLYSHCMSPKTWKVREAFLMITLGKVHANILALEKSLKVHSFSPQHLSLLSVIMTFSSGTSTQGFPILYCFISKSCPKLIKMMDRYVL